MDPVVVFTEMVKRSQLSIDPMVTTTVKGIGAAGSTFLAAMAPMWTDATLYLQLAASMVGLVSAILFTMSLAMDVKKKWKQRNQP